MDELRPTHSLLIVIFFSLLTMEVSSVLKNAQIKQIRNWYRMPVPVLWHIPTSFDHSAAVPKSLHWNPLKCYIHFKELLLFSEVLNAKLESLSNLLFALCSQSPMRDHSQWVYWFAPTSLRDSNPTASCCCVSQHRHPLPECPERPVILSSEI